MKIAVTSTKPSLDDRVEARFGRTPYYIFVDTETMEYEAVQNPNVAAGGGAGIHSAQLMTERGIQCVLTGNCGPNAFQVFNSAGIQVIVNITGTVRQAVEQFKSGTIAAAGQPNVASHFGMGMGRSTSQGKTSGQAASHTPFLENPVFHLQKAGGEEIDTLKKQAHALERQLQDTERRMNQVKRGKVRAIAHVDDQNCGGCGMCIDCCPVGAITIDDVAVIDKDKCIGCGACIDECPLDAISMR